MVVVVLVAIATGIASLSLRDAAQGKLEEEGARLSALLESARAQSRIVGTDVHWAPASDGSGFQFVGLPPLSTAELPTHWLDTETHAEVVGATQVVLGPEPLLPAQRIVLHLGEHTVAVGTDGLAPFQIVTPADTVAAQ